MARARRYQLWRTSSSPLTDKGTPVARRGRKARGLGPRSPSCQRELIVAGIHRRPARLRIVLFVFGLLAAVVASAAPADTGSRTSSATAADSAACVADARKAHRTASHRAARARR